MKIFKKLIGEENAQALVEFTLIFPILILLILGMIEFGWLLNAKITLNSAVREGARVAVVLDTTDENRETIVLAAVKRITDTSGLVLINDECTIVEKAETVHTDDIEVFIKATIDPIIGLYVSDTVEMTSIARMRRE